MQIYKALLTARQTEIWVRDKSTLQTFSCLEPLVFALIPFSNHVTERKEALGTRV